MVNCINFGGVKDLKALFLSSPQSNNNLTMYSDRNNSKWCVHLSITWQHN